jgi:hypothetical protein
MGELSHHAGRTLVLALFVAVLGCAEGYESRESSASPPSSNTGSTVPSDQRAAQNPINQQPSTPATIAQGREDARFVATEEGGAKVWKAGGANIPTTVNLQNRGSKPLTLKAVNMLPAEHGFAIDTMNVKEVLGPGEEKIITVAAENIDPSVAEHRVYCQLHPKHMAAALLVVQKPDAKGEQTIEGSRTQSGEISSRVPDTGDSQTRETEGQRVIREQSQRQRQIDSTSSDVQAPGSTAPKTCEGFPGFDRGCPGSGK